LRSFPAQLNRWRSAVCGWLTSCCPLIRKPGALPVRLIFLSIPPVSFTVIPLYRQQARSFLRDLVRLGSFPEEESAQILCKLLQRMPSFDDCQPVQPSKTTASAERKTAAPAGRQISETGESKRRKAAPAAAATAASTVTEGDSNTVAVSAASAASPPLDVAAEQAPYTWFVGIDWFYAVRNCVVESRLHASMVTAMCLLVSAWLTFWWAVSCLFVCRSGLSGTLCSICWRNCVTTRL
jgi:hypothetical protein